MEVVVTFLEAILPRKKPAPRFPGPGAAAALLNEVRPYDIQTPYRYHQHTARAVVLAACQGHIEVGAVAAAEEFREALCKKTGWQQPRTFIDLANNVPAPERTDRTIDLGCIWRLCIVKYFAHIWTAPPTLTELRGDVATVQQAALYCPEVLAPLLCRMSEKYDDGLWIIGEHYNSWRALHPRISWSWGKLLPEDWDGTPDWRPSRELRTDVDFDCMHILHEIELHQQVTSNRGKTGNALLAKVVEECWHQWRWCGRGDPTARGQFRHFQRFVEASMELVAPRDVRKGCRNTIHGYVKSLVEEEESGRPRWHLGEETIPGAKRAEMVRGHSKTYYAPRRRNFLPILRIRLKAFWNLVRGYPATWDNHDRIM